MSPCIIITSNDRIRDHVLKRLSINHQNIYYSNNQNKILLQFAACHNMSNRVTNYLWHGNSFVVRSIVWIVILKMPFKCRCLLPNNMFHFGRQARLYVIYISSKKIAIIWWPRYMANIKVTSINNLLLQIWDKSKCPFLGH